MLTTVESEKDNFSIILICIFWIKRQMENKLPYKAKYEANEPVEETNFAVYSRHHILSTIWAL